MLERDNSARNLWNSYGEIHHRSPNPDSQEKANFYLQHSDFTKRNHHNPNPEIAVVIPAYNEENYLARTLASINAAFESNSNACLIVVDNASTDATAEIVQEFSGILVKESKKGIGQARQTGLEAVPSSVKYVLTTDADTVIPKDWISLHQETLSRPHIVFTYGEYQFFIENSVNFTDKIGYFTYINLATFVRKMKGLSFQPVGGSNNGFEKKSAITCGGYNRNLKCGEDFDLYKKLLSFGDAVYIDNIVLTSARRFIGENPWAKITDRILIRSKTNTDNQYIDYRSK